MTGTSPSDEPAGTARLGPWTFRTCVTAVCTRCGAAPLDEDTGIAPHFTSAAQAADELARDWGWRVTTRAGQWDQLLCPACSLAGGDSRPQAPAAADGQGPGTAPRRGDPGQAPHPALPTNARVPPTAGRTREGG
jgi:hypothetical protein